MKQKSELRIAMLGMIEGNGHPFSWSAIINGYNAAEIKRCPYPGIIDYLSHQPKTAFGIEGAAVTHVWTDRPEDSEHVALFANIPHTVKSPLEVIGEVDAVIIATDNADEHLERCRPFIEAGLPVFVDKPLATKEDHLQQFIQWVEEGKLILSSSCMRYGKEYAPFRMSTSNLGAVRFASVTTHRSWERYGIHALEAIYPILGPGFESVRFVGNPEEALRSYMLLHHKSGTDVLITAVEDMLGSFGCLQLCGTRSSAYAAFSDTFYAFKSQLLEFVQYIRTGYSPFPFSETVELMNIIMAGIHSRQSDGITIYLEPANVHENIS